MITLKIVSSNNIYTEQAETMEQLKRLVLDCYNVKGFKFYEAGSEELATTFHKFFQGVKASK